MAGVDRSEALATIASAHAATGQVAPPVIPDVTLTGNTVEAGGDVERVLVRVALLTYRDAGGLLQYPAAVPGDVIRVDQEQADRLDGLGATVEAGAFEGDAMTGEEVADATSADDADAEPVFEPWTDEAIGTASAADLVAYVEEHPDEAARVHAIEAAKPASRQRAGVLEASAPTE